MSDVGVGRLSALSKRRCRADSSSADRRRTGLLGHTQARLLGLLIVLAVLLLTVLASIAYGTKTIDISIVLAAFANYDPALSDHLIVRSMRLPRTALGLLVGVALGLAGGVMQGVTRNPLADPGILGINAGAALFVVIAIYWFGIGTLPGFVWFSFVGAALAGIVVYLVGSLGPAGTTPVKLALAGVAMAASLESVTRAIVLSDAATLNIFRFWIVGSLAGRDTAIVAQVAPFIIVGAVIALATARSLNALALGDDVARALGQRVGLARLFSAMSVVLLVGAATAAAGPIAFVGLMIPHVARAITGPDYRWVLAYSALLAPTLLLSADIIGRLVVRPGELQVGIVTALIGGPFFIALVRRRKLATL